MESFTVRKISYGEGVERVFPVLSPKIDRIEVLKRGKVRRAKLYYLRDRRGKSARIFRIDQRPHQEDRGRRAPDAAQDAKAAREAEKIAAAEALAAELAAKEAAEKKAAEEAAAAEAAQADAAPAEDDKVRIIFGPLSHIENPGQRAGVFSLPCRE